MNERMQKIITEESWNLRNFNSGYRNVTKKVQTRQEVKGKKELRLKVESQQVRTVCYVRGLGG